MQRTHSLSGLLAGFALALSAPLARAQCEVAILDDAAPPTFGADYGRAVALHGERCVHGPGQGTPGPGSGRVVSHV